MPVKTQCPRCKQPLAVPSKLVGSYANCPRCRGRFWISKDAPVDGSSGDAAGTSGAVLTLTQVAEDAAPSVAVPPSQHAAAPPLVVQASRLPENAGGPASGYPPAPQSEPPRAFFPSVTPSVPIPLPGREAAAGPPEPPPQARKIARLVSADAAQSSLKIAADGQLPSLQLEDVDHKEKGQGKSRSIPPLVLVGAWVFSVVMTIAIVFALSGNDSDSTTPEKAKAMREIEEQFFGDPLHGPLLPYQQLLRQARQAHAREDLKAERRYYQRVLDLLRTESRQGGQSSPGRLEKGVTGTRENDQELEKKIITVLGD
jgi:hypothetical protein